MPSSPQSVVVCEREKISMFMKCTKAMVGDWRSKERPRRQMFLSRLRKCNKRLHEARTNAGSCLVQLEVVRGWWLFLPCKFEFCLKQEKESRNEGISESKTPPHLLPICLHLPRKVDKIPLKLRKSQ